MSSPQNFLFCWLPKTHQPCQIEWKKTAGVLQDLLHVYTMYVLSVCLTQTFMLKFSTARVLLVEKLRESYSHHLLCATAGRKSMRPPLTGKSQRDFFRSLAQGAGKCSEMGHTARDCCPEEHFISLKYTVFTVTVL